MTTFLLQRYFVIRGKVNLQDTVCSSMHHHFRSSSTCLGKSSSWEFQNLKNAHVKRQNRETISFKKQNINQCHYQVGKSHKNNKTWNCGRCWRIKQSSHHHLCSPHPSMLRNSKGPVEGMQWIPKPWRVLLPQKMPFAAKNGSRPPVSPSPKNSQCLKADKNRETKYSKDTLNRKHDNATIPWKSCN